jgi:hypothetical protein
MPSWIASVYCFIAVLCGDAWNLIGRVARRVSGIAAR